MYFGVNITVTADLHTDERLDKIPVECFECIHCGAIAEEEPLNKED